MASSGAASSAASSGAPAKLAQPASPVQATQIMNWFAQSAHGAFFTAQMKGYYDKVNLKMTTDQGGPQTPVLPLIASGKYMFGMLSQDQVLLARQDGVPVVGVFAPFQNALSGLMYHQSHPVASFPDLQGRKVYVTATADYWLYIVKKYNLDKAQQFTYNGQLAEFLADESAVQQCFVSSEPLAAKQQGIAVGYLKVGDSGFNAYTDMITTTEQVIKEKPELVQAYVTASLQGWKDYLADPTATLAYIKTLNKDTDLNLSAQAAAIEKPFAYATGSSDPKVLGTMTVQRFKEMHDGLRSVGLLKADIDYKAAVNTTFIDAAQAAAS